MNVDWRYLPNYDSDPDVAIEQIAEDFAEENYTDPLGTEWTTKVTSSKQFEFQEQPALLQRFTITTSRPFLYCNTVGYRVIAVPKYWNVKDGNVQRAVWLEAEYCKGLESRYGSEVQRIADSLRLIEP